MTVITRFAPSPTGFLHVGGARTAFFNWLYARHTGGKFLLRIEDTDRARSTDEAVQAIFDGLDWLGLAHDGDVVFQFSGAERHTALALQLLETGHAYRCWCTPDELTEMREQARTERRRMLYDRRWRDRDPAEAPAGITPVIRFRAPITGETVVEDLVQGAVRVANAQLDDMILLRSDGTPTYMLSVVADDHDMNVTHAIRGDDHLTNAARQTQLFLAFNWQPPQYAHIPLIHGTDGTKLSKRHGALAVADYAEMGILAEAMCNYLLRLGWSHGNDEIISREQAIEWFELSSIGRSPARFDIERLNSLNGYYISQANDSSLLSLLEPHIANLLESTPDPALLERLESLLPSLKTRANNLLEVAENALFLFLQRPLHLDKQATKYITSASRIILTELLTELETLDDWRAENLEPAVSSFINSHALKMRDVAQPLRAALTGKSVSPGIFDVMISLGREESLGRLSDVATQAP